MGNRHYVGEGLNWNSTDSWSESEGGSAGASIPTTGDSVYFNSGGGLCILTSDVKCGALHIESDYTGLLSGDYTVKSYGTGNIAGPTNLSNLAIYDGTSLTDSNWYFTTGDFASVTVASDSYISLTNGYTGQHLLAYGSVTLPVGTTIKATTLDINYDGYIDGGTVTIPTGGSIDSLYGVLSPTNLIISGDITRGDYYGSITIGADLTGEYTYVFRGNVTFNSDSSVSGDGSYEFFNNLTFDAGASWYPNDGQVYFGGTGNQTVTFNSLYVDEVYSGKSAGTLTFADGLQTSGNFYALGKHVLDFTAGTTSNVSGDFVVNQPKISGTVNGCTFNIGGNFYAYSADQTETLGNGGFTINAAGNIRHMGPYVIQNCTGVNTIIASSSTDAGSNSGITFSSDYMTGSVQSHRSTVFSPGGSQYKTELSHSDSAILDLISSRFHDRLYYKDFKKGKS